MAERPTTHSTPMTSAAASRLTIPLARNPARGFGNDNMLGIIVIVGNEDGFAKGDDAEDEDEDGDFP